MEYGVRHNQTIRRQLDCGNSLFEIFGRLDRNSELNGKTEYLLDIMPWIKWPNMTANYSHRAPPLN